MPTNLRKEQLKGLTIWAVILVVVVILVVGVVALSFILPWREAKPPAEPPLAVMSCVGTIEEISDNTIKVKAEKERNPFTEDRVFTITVNERTVIDKMEDVYSKVEVNQEGRTILMLDPRKAELVPPKAPKDTGQKLITIADMKTGGLITAESSEDIQNKDTFTAIRIKYIE